MNRVARGLPVVALLLIFLPVAGWAQWEMGNQNGGGVSGNPVAAFSRHPLWPGGAPGLLLPGRPVTVGLWGMSLEDRWGPDRNRTPHLRSLPLVPVLGFRAGGAAVPGALVTRGQLGGSTLLLHSLLPPGDGWVSRGVGGYHALSLMGDYRDGIERRQWPEFQSGSISVAGAGWLVPGEVAVEGGVDHRRFQRPDWGNSYERAGEGAIGIPVEDAQLFRELLRQREGRSRDGDLVARNLVHHSTSAAGRGIWRSPQGWEVGMAAMGYLAREEDDLRTDPFALDGSFPELVAHGTVARLHGNWTAVQGLTLDGALSGRWIRERGGAPSRAPEVLAIRPVPLPGGGVTTRTLLAGVPWGVQGDTLRESELEVVLGGRWVQGNVSVRVWGEVAGTTLERVQRPGALGRYIFSEASGLERGQAEWSERLLYQGDQGAAEARIHRHALHVEAQLEWVEGLTGVAGLGWDARRFSRVAAGNVEATAQVGSGALDRPAAPGLLLPRLGLHWQLPEVPGLSLAGEFRARREPLPHGLLLTAYRTREAIRVECRLPGPAPLTAPPDPDCPGAASRREDAAGGDVVVFTEDFREPVWLEGEAAVQWEGWGWRIRAAWEEGWNRHETVLSELNRRTTPGSGSPLAPVDPEAGSVVGVGSVAGARARRAHLGVEGRMGGFLWEAHGVRRHARSRGPWETADPFRRLLATPVDGVAGPILAPDRLDSGDALLLGVTRTGMEGAVTLGLRYHQRSGIPFTWSVQGDLNGDGVSGNDVLTFPDGGLPLFRRSEDRAALEALLASDPCLQAIRAGASPVNRCRGSTLRQIDLTGRFLIPLPGWRVTVDVENLTGGLSRKWGRMEVPPAMVPLLRVVGRDPATDDPVFDLVVPQRDGWVLRPQSLWRARVGMEVLLP